MHPALLLDEILLSIFLYCHGQCQYLRHPPTDLVALASTCRAFKEPALDVLWMELKNLTSLVRCLPRLSVVKISITGSTSYMFKRELEPAELDTVKSYTRRVRNLTISRWPGVERESIADLCRDFTNGPLFPKIERLSLAIANETLPFTYHVAVPRITLLDISIALSNISSCKGFIRLLGSNCSNVKTFQDRSFYFDRELETANKLINQQIRCWTRLQVVECDRISLSFSTLVHLSRAPGLTTLSFTLQAETTVDQSAPQGLLYFSALKRMRIKIGSIAFVVKIFPRMRFPAIKDVEASFHEVSYPKHAIRSLLIALQGSCMHQFQFKLSTMGSPSPHGALDLEYPMLAPEDLYHMTALDLTKIDISLHQSIDLKDSDMVELSLGCKQLESLQINQLFGWRAAGITPGGMTRLLQECALLQRLCIVLDTRGYTLPQMPPASSRDPPHRKFSYLNVADSVIEAESVPAMAALLASISEPGWSISILSWCASDMREYRQDWEVHRERWNEVYELKRKMSLERYRETTVQAPGCMIL